MAAPLEMQFEGEKNSRIDIAYNSSDRNRFFSETECEAVIDWAEERAAWVRNRYEADLGEYGKAIRESSVFKLDPAVPNGEIDWLLSKIGDIVSALNRKIWHFDLTELGVVHITRYEEGDQHTQHVDLSDDFCDCKIFFMAQLSPADAYQGGTLEYGFQPTPASRAQGSVMAFPAWVPHRVTPVTSGRRYSVNCFALGPSFR